MKKLICLFLLIASFFFTDNCFALKELGIVSADTHRIEDAYWEVPTGKLFLRDGTWRFGQKRERQKTIFYTCFCKFTIINNSTKTYIVTPSVYLNNKDGFKLTRISYSNLEEEGKTLMPGESYTFKYEASVTRSDALKASKVEIRLESLYIIKRPEEKPHPVPNE